MKTSILSSHRISRGGWGEGTGEFLFSFSFGSSDQGGTQQVFAFLSSHRISRGGWGGGGGGGDGGGG